MIVKTEINNNSTRSIIRAAVSTKNSYQVCERKIEATLACGSAVAGISLKAIKSELLDLKNIINVSCGDILREVHCDRSHLEDHFKRIMVLHHTFCLIIGCPPSTDEGTPKLDCNGLVISKIKGDKAKLILNNFKEILFRFNDTKNKIGDILIPSKVRKNDKHDIEYLLKEVTATNLTIIENILKSALRNIRSIMKDVNCIWDEAIKEIELDDRSN